MRKYASVFVVVAALVLAGLAAYAADLLQSSFGILMPSVVAQAEEGKDQLPSGEVQERAVPCLAPGGALFQPMTPGAPLPLPGQFVVQTFRENYLTVVDGGSRTTNVIVSAPAPIRRARMVSYGKKWRVAASTAGTANLIIHPIRESWRPESHQAACSARATRRVLCCVEESGASRRI